MIKSITHIIDGIKVELEDKINFTQIAQSGQCFRINEVSENTFQIIANDKLVEITQVDDYSFLINCSDTDFEFWKMYLDLDRNYNEIIEKVAKSDNEYIKTCVEKGFGLRLLQQDLWEMLISFIISQRNNIPRITSTINKMCECFGEKKQDSRGNYFFAFPTPESLALETKESLNILRLGYRDEYILKLAKDVSSNEKDLDLLKSMEFSEAYKNLLNIRGVGPKVANCVSLFGLNNVDAFPIDVWIQRILDRYYNGKWDNSEFDGINGIIQMYMFFAVRH